MDTYRLCIKCESSLKILLCVVYADNYYTINTKSCHNNICHKKNLYEITTINMSWKDTE